MSINGDINNNTSNNNDIEVAKLRRVLTILLSVSAILAVVLVTVGISRIVRYMQTSEASGSTPVIATIVSTEMTFTEPVVYHTEQLEASDLVENYFRPLPEARSRPDPSTSARASTSRRTCSSASSR